MLIRPLQSADEAAQCARMMCGTEPWITLGRGYAECLTLVTDPTREVLVAEDGGIRGFIVLLLQGAFVGYIQSVCVAADARGSGLGTRLLGVAEERIFRQFPNVFLCVSSFNPGARALYERLGYVLVGELADYVVAGHSELLMRKTRGPMRSYRAGEADPAMPESRGGSAMSRVVAAFGYRHEAEYARELLAAAGIPSLLQASDAAGINGGMLFSNPARLIVNDEDVEEATEVLSAAGILPQD